MRVRFRFCAAHLAQIAGRVGNRYIYDELWVTLGILALATEQSQGKLPVSLVRCPIIVCSADHTREGDPNCA